MKKTGFSFVEMLIVVAMIMVLLVSGALFINNFNSRQKVEAAKREIVSGLQLARNYARSKQTPYGFTGELKYIEVKLNSDGKMVVVANGIAGVGTSYFSKDVSADGIIVSGADMNFSLYSGKLVNVSGGTMSPVDINSPINIGVSSIEGAGETKTVVIKSSGQINEN